MEEWKQEKLIALNFEFERNEFDRRNTEYMPFNQARSVAQSLGFESMYDYLSWARGTLSEYGNFPTKLPRSPQQVYRGKGWTNWNDFLGTETKALKDQQAWEEMFLQYGAYVEKHGVGEISWKDAGPKLSHWVNTQRQFQREGRLDPERKRRLDERGFDWNPKLDGSKRRPAAEQ